MVTGTMRTSSPWAIPPGTARGMPDSSTHGVVCGCSASVPARINDARGRLYPFGVESMALRHPHVCRAAFVGHRGQRILVLELRRGAPVPDLTGLAKDLTSAHLDEVQLHRHIPVDAGVTTPR